MNNLPDSNILSKIDLVSEYRHTQIHPDYIPKTAITSHFSIKNSEKTFQQFVNQVLLGSSFVYTYKESLLMASKDETESNSFKKTI